jgi:hypothetical protein
MRKCIWCSKDEHSATFTSIAHIVPKSLGGNQICKNVCDDCNHLFGNYFNKYPGIDTVIKETFNITRWRMLHGTSGIDKNSSMRFSSIFFKVDFEKGKMELKANYKYHSSFQEKICRQLKKGLYKMYLEEVEREKGIGHDSKFDFIREFVRYNLGDYPIFYFERVVGAIFSHRDWLKNPVFFLDGPYHYLVSEPGFFEVEFLGHVFGIATSRYWRLSLDNYIKKSKEAKKKFFGRCLLIKKFNDIDLTLNIFDRK